MSIRFPLGPVWKGILLFLCFWVAIAVCPAALYAQGSGKSDAARARQQSLDSAREARQAVLDAAQIARKQSLDSAREARQFALDSARDSRTKQLEEAKVARERMLDSSRQAREQSLDAAKEERNRMLDSTRAVRKSFSDSLAAMRKYRGSKRYKDSVTRSREDRLSGIRNEIKARTDSAREVRTRALDSTKAIRMEALAERKAFMKQRSDSLAAIRKYRNSRRYADSTKVVKQARVDSIRQKREIFLDSSRAARTTLLEAQKADRKRILDSGKAVRKIFLDSLTAMRKVRTDSIAAKKLAREKQSEINQKQKDAKRKLSLELKINKKREAWNNEKMLKKRWGFPRRPLQNLFTHYNYYFNANRKMEEAKKNMERLARDDYDGPPIRLFSFNPDTDSSKLVSDMDSVIQKTSLGVQIHDPRVKWSDDLYLLLGQAYYYKGNYDEALNTFKYVISLRNRYKTREQKQKEATRRRKSKEVETFVEKDKKGVLSFAKHKSVHNQGLLWMARTYTQSGKFEEAQAVLDLLSTDSNFPERLEGELALEQSFLALQQNNTRAAMESLQLVSADKGTDNFMRRRAAYLAGQLLAERGNYAAAAAQFDKVSDLHPKLEMDFYAKKNKTYNLMKAGGDQEETIAALKKLLRDNKYEPYYEQIYFVLGQASASNGDVEEAVNYLSKSTQSSKTTKKQKAISFASLGNLYFNKGNYEGAKTAYDSAAHFAIAAEGDSSVALAISRGMVLDAVAKPSAVIRTNDSLLSLAALSESEQRTFVRRYIRKLAQAKSDSANAAQNAGVNAVAGAAPTTGPSTSGNVQTWYFANSGLMQQGYNEFRRKWGNRQLRDDWRRSGAANTDGGIAGNNAITPSTTGNQQDDVELDEEGLPTEAYLLGIIPNTEERKNTAIAANQRAYVDLSTAYVQQFNDYNKGTATLDSLQSKYKNHPYGAEETYLRYLIALRETRLTEAQGIAAQLLLEFPESKWAKLVQPQETGNLEQNLAAGSTASVYQEAYDLVQARKYGEALAKVRIIETRNERTFNSRTSIVKAMALAGAGNYDQADTVITQFLTDQPNDSLKTWAQKVQEFIKKQQRTQALVTDSIKKVAALKNPTISANTPLAVDSNTSSGTQTSPVVQKPEAYRFNPTEPHLFVFVFGSMESRVMGVKAGLSDFNNIKFSEQKLSTYLEAISANKGLLITKGFTNTFKAKQYLKEFQSTSIMTREFKPEEYQVFLISESNLLKLKEDKDLEAYLNFYKQRYR